ncbi:MAG: CSLREA domain-containing protein [Chloroflexaceae bacterium]|nr:CSLREA domain-containing protein [Chloroflexaceae bacterium]
MGDVNNDGWLDVIAAGPHQHALHILPGAAAGLTSVQRHALPGSITALLVDDVNRRDGLADIVVGIDDSATPRLLVFEGAQGALAAAPETIALPHPARALAVGQLDGQPGHDIAVAAGREVLILHGRDRHLSQDSQRRAAVAAPHLSRWYATLEPVALAVGNFAGTAAAEVAALDATGRLALLDPRDGTVQALHLPGTAATHLQAARVSGLPTDDLLLLNPTDDTLHLLLDGAAADTAAHADRVLLPYPLSGAGAVVLPTHFNRDARSDLVVLTADQPAPHIVQTQANRTYVVTEVDDTDDGTCRPTDCTLREAINAANENSGPDAIAFDLDSGMQTIAISTSLPAIVEPLTIDGTTQPGYRDTPLIVLNGQALDTGTLLNQTSSDALVFDTDSSAVLGLGIVGFSGSGIVLRGNGHRVQSSVVGLLPDETSLLPNDRHGIVIDDGAQNLIGGPTDRERNSIAGNRGTGIVVQGAAATENQIQGNDIGIIGSASVNAAASDITPGNGQGGIVIEDGSDNTIGGTEAGLGNVVAGNLGTGIAIVRSRATGNIIQGNLIGTGRDGIEENGNTGAGIALEGAAGNTIGGTASSARNIIAANNTGIVLRNSSTTDTVIQGNAIGVDATGSAMLGNSNGGIVLNGVVENSIGGVVPEARNIIAGNTGSGIIIMGSNATRNRVQGNYIGTDQAGGIALGNSEHGVVVEAPGNLIGGTDAGTGNVLSGNRRSGVRIANATAEGNQIQGNRIGTDQSGTRVLGNGEDGVVIINAARTVLGGMVPAARNIIATNQRHGVVVQGDQAENTRIQGNLIGLDAIGETVLGNAGSGIFLAQSVNTEIGGASPEAANVIAGSRTNGIFASFSTATVQHNTISQNDVGLRVQGGRVMAIGNTLTNNRTVFAIAAGQLRGYVNSITNYGTAVLSTGGSFLGSYNWWGRSTGSAPAGLNIDVWNNRLYAEPAEWVVGDGSAELGAARLTGGTGIAIVVRYERESFEQAAASADTIASRLCSDYYGFFAIDGGGTWRIRIPIDERAPCNQTLQEQLVYWVPQPLTCRNDLTREDCWQPFPGEGVRGATATTNEQSIVIANVRAGDLRGVAYAAGPLVPTELPITLLAAGALVGVLLLALLLFVLWRRRTTQPAAAPAVQSTAGEGI